MILILLVMSSGILFHAAAQGDEQIDGIRHIYAETNKLIGESEKNGEGSEIYLTELIVNKNNTSYPAVGIYNSTVRFYYTYGDREKNPYPNRLIKIVVKTNRSARTETEELLFNEKGELIFIYRNNGETETRAYFNSGRAIRLLENTANVNLQTSASRSAVTAIQKRAASLAAAFKNLLEQN